jgi:oxygen-independent coproporphyrinogen-3 oxidase
MDIYLRNHNYKYALEQMLLTLFPDERPSYPETEVCASSSCLISELYMDAGSKALFSHSILRINGTLSEGRAEYICSSRPYPESGLLFDRIGQKLVKLSFFNAAQSFLAKLPPWGSITGVHPVKLAARYMEENSCGKDEAAHYLQSEYTVLPEKAVLCADAAEVEIRVRHSLSSGGVSLYVGIPFCPTRCSYCSFVSHSIEKSMNLIEPYLNSLHKEINAAAAILKELGLTVDSVYIGGGTPTTLTAAQLSELISKIRSNFDLSLCGEFTVEAGRPDTITPEKLSVIEKSGVTRISINPQSMNDSVLSVIGRRHTGGDILESYHLARGIFSGAINMDLIAGLPTDTAEEFIKSLETLIGLNPENITVHTLTAKRGSGLTSEKKVILDDDRVGQMLSFSNTALRKAGFQPYYLYRQKFSSGGHENVGWCRNGYESIYNIVMMEELQSVLSLGAGGVTKLVDKDTGKISRITNKKYPKEYIESIDDIIKGKKYILDFLSGTKKHLLSSQ